MPDTTRADGQTVNRTGGYTKNIQVTPIISSGTAYVPGDSVGAVQQLASAVMDTGGTAMLTSLVLVDGFLA